MKLPAFRENQSQNASRLSGDVGFEPEETPRRKTSMIQHPREAIPEVPSELQVSDALLKQARKLRWMGLNEEADRTQTSLQQSALAGSVLTVPRETD
jgi:hypothetical protein